MIAELQQRSEKLQKKLDQSEKEIDRLNFDLFNTKKEAEALTKKIFNER